MISAALVFDFFSLLYKSMFELIGSEVSYLKSLGVLVNHFYASKVLKKTMSTMEHHTLFYNIRRVMEANTKFLLDLEARLGESLIIFQVGDIVLQHCGNFKQYYVPYVTNMTYQESLVNQNFVYALKKLERDPVCQKQGLKSFLILPFQRITRMKLLLELHIQYIPEANGQICVRHSLHSPTTADGKKALYHFPSASQASTPLSSESLEQHQKESLKAENSLSVLREL
uniref:DH domain-containing protein n=1 Tax=Poecilia reticulata TaxID=8081 RepID=A0A3P9N948_POERE